MALGLFLDIALLYRNFKNYKRYDELDNYKTMTLQDDWQNQDCTRRITILLTQPWLYKTTNYSTDKTMTDQVYYNVNYWKNHGCTKTTNYTTDNNMTVQDD